MRGQFLFCFEENYTKNNIRPLVEYASSYELLGWMIKVLRAAPALCMSAPFASSPPLSRYRRPARRPPQEPSTDLRPQDANESIALRVLWLASCPLSSPNWRRCEKGFQNRFRWSHQSRYRGSQPRNNLAANNRH